MYEMLQKLKCTVVKREGNKPTYEVLVEGDDTQATLVCNEPLTPGDEVLGLFGGYLEGEYVLSIESNEILRLQEVNKNR